MNYRNKTIFDWKDFQFNDISSIISLNIMQIFKSHFDHLDIHNVIIRDVEKQIGIIFQINKIEFNKVEGIHVYNFIVIFHFMYREVKLSFLTSLVFP